MKAALLDLNVLLALAWPSHEHHEAAHRWFGKLGKRSWATCPWTQVGFVRLSCNPKVVDPVASPQSAATLVRAIVARRQHVFWRDDADCGQLPNWPPTWVTSYRQVSDSHLLRLAERHDGMIATFDRAFAAAADSRRIELVASQI